MRDAAEIVVMSDHGTLTVQPLAASGQTSDVPWNARSSALALLLNKKPFARGALRTNEAPLINSDLACLLGLKSAHLDEEGFRGGDQRIASAPLVLFLSVETRKLEGQRHATHGGICGRWPCL